jgi:two-component system sensor histidine kinase CiaH
VIQGVVLNSRDVTERKLAEEALREAHDKLEMRVQERTAEIVKMMAQLEQAHHTQRRFVADASHDLRTPLTVIAIEIDLLLRTPGFDEITYESLQRITGEVGQLNDLASDLLLLTMLDDPQPQDMRRQEHLDAILLDEINQLTSLVTEKGVRWNVAIDQGVEYRCDLHAMRRALANVLENAVKYSSEGSTITVSLRYEDGCALVSVEDQGMGIDPEDHERVFERFYRSDKARSTPGTGLGLSIVKAVVEAHGGRVRLESEPGIGTTIIISLPF